MLKKSMLLGLITFTLIAVFPAFAGGGTDLKGQDIVIGQYWGPDYDVKTYQPKTPVEEQVLAWRTQIQQENGFTMREKEIATWGEMQGLAATSIMTGTPPAHVFVLEPAWAIALMAQGLLYPVGDNKAVNFKKPAPAAKSAPLVNWNQAAIDSMTFNGKIYGFAQGINLYNASAIFFNKRLFREAGLDPDLPYNMQKDGTWTWDNFLDMCKKLTRDINNDGIIDTYALPRDLSTDILSAILGSNGAQYVDKDRSGKFVNATGRPEFLEALQFAIRMKDEGVMKPPPENGNWDWYKTEFYDGKVAMRIDDTYVWAELANLKDDWGMVLFPKGPRKKEYAVYSRDNILVIPATYKADQVDKIMQAVALWYTPVNDDWKSGLYNQFRDSRAVDETLNLVHTLPHTTKIFTYIRGLSIGDIAHQMWWHEGDPAQLIEAVSQSWDAIISDSNF